MKRSLLTLFAGLVVSVAAQDLPADLLLRSTFQYFNQSDYNTIIQKGMKYAVPSKWGHGVVQISQDFRALIEPNHGERVLTYAELELYDLLQYAEKAELKDKPAHRVMGFFFELFSGRVASGESYNDDHRYADDEILNLKLHLLASYMRTDNVSTMKDLEALLEADPNNLAANSLKGGIEYALGKWQNCIDWYSRTVEISPDYAYGYFMQGMAYAELGRVNEAEEELKESLSYFPGNPMAASRLGKLYLQENRYEEAIGPYKRTLVFDSSHFWVYGDLGHCFHKLGQSDSALYYLDKAVRMQPDVPDYYVSMGDVYYKNGEYGSAKYLYSKAIEKDPGFVPGWTARGDACLRLNQFEEARSDYIKVLSIDPAHNYAALRVGSSYYFNGQYQEAISAYEEAIQMNPADHYLYYMTGMSYIELGDNIESISYMEKSLSLDSTYLPAWTNLGWVYYLEGDFMKCLEYSKGATALDPEEYIAGFNSALALLRLGRIDESYESYRDLVAQHTGIDLAGATGDLTDLVDQKIMTREARYILRNIMKLN